MAFLGAASWSGRTSAAAYAAALAVAALAAAAAVPGARADFSSDRAECADKLVGMMTCLAYVQGAAAAPTPDCCTGLKQVLQTSKKCLCVLIKDRDDPNLGFKINATRALALPDVCKAASNISECPKLLNLNSTEAQIFDQFVKEHGAQSSPSSGAGLAGAGGQKSGVGAGKKWLLGLRVDKVGATFFCLVYLIVSIFVIVG